MNKSSRLEYGRRNYPCAIINQEFPIIVCNSPIHGQGCFSAVEISMGEIIIEYTGERITLHEAVRRDHRRCPEFSQYILALDDNTFIDGAKGGNASRFINHSCNPNCTILRTDDRAFIVASQTLTMGEELTIDYDYEDGQHEPCCCGVQNCRGFI